MFGPPSGEVDGNRAEHFCNGLVDIILEQFEVGGVTAARSRRACRPRHPRQCAHLGKTPLRKFEHTPMASASVCGLSVIVYVPRTC